MKTLFLIAFFMAMFFGLLPEFMATCLMIAGVWLFLCMIEDDGR